MIRISEGIRQWTNLSTRRLLTVWTIPELGYLKWNVDRSSLGKPERSGVGLFFARDHEERLMSVSSILAGIKYSNEAELIAILEAMQLSVDSGITKEVNGIIESDSANAISWLCMKPDKRQETTKYL